jgi:acetylornithine deacetylase/succinyl-diaminopimelate desuccinylase-like protein
MKTVIPARASAKLSCRLVVDQDPKEIERGFREHLVSRAPDGVEVDVRLLHGSPGWRADLDPELLAAASEVLHETFGNRPVLVGGGGSLPVITDLERVLGVSPLLVGFGLPDENAHAPDEFLDLSNFDRGIRAVALLWERLTRS